MLFHEVEDEGPGESPGGSEGGPDPPGLEGLPPAADLFEDAGGSGS